MKSLKCFKQWKPSVAAALPLVVAATSAWAGPLRDPDRGLDRATLTQDTRYMRGVFQEKVRGTQADFITIDLADPAQHRFVMNRLRGAGKTAQNSPRLFERLQQARERAVAGKTATVRTPEGSTMAFTEGGWGCDHFLAVSYEALSAGSWLFKTNPWAACLNGATYTYADVSSYNANAGETELQPVQSAAGEEYGAGQSFDAVVITPSIPAGQNRHLVLDSMMIAMNEYTGEELITFTSASTAALAAQRPALDLRHPRFAGARKPDVSLCQLRGGSDCDYAVVGNDAGTLKPYMATATGVALRKTDNPWVGDGAHFFPFNSGTTFTQNSVYVPLDFAFNAGTEVLDPGTVNEREVPCTITSIGTASKVRLVKPVTGGTCASVSDLRGDLAGAVGTNGATFHRLLDMTRETPFAGSGTEDCSMQRITNQAVELVTTVSTRVSCGRPTETAATVTVRTKSDPRYNFNLFILNSCLAEGTSIVRADGTLAPVERIQKGDRVVANGSGRVLTVTDVARGGEDKPLVRLHDDKGHVVSLTERHPVVLSSGAVLPAVEVKANQRVRTREGVAAITSVERLPYKGQVYNLTVGTPEELATLSPAERTFFAGGLLVGDNSMQTELSTPKLDSRDVVARLPRSWHRDYAARPSFTAGQR